ncbi:MAG: glycosyltransferase family 4 protein [Bacteroidales bacterium]|nr:glycosyltransferase family 4 protein [Bacteroidales bacterium]
MKIAVNTRLLIKNKLDGIGWFTFETLRRIVRSHPEVEFYFLFDRHYDPGFIFGPNVTPVVLNPPARHPVLFMIWFEWSVSRALKEIKPDLFLSPDGYLSLSTAFPSLAVIHDLNFEHFPKDLPLLVRWYYRYFFPRFARKATRLVTVSEFSKLDIINQYNIPPGKIDVIYNGANEAFIPVYGNEISSVRERFTNGCPYFIFVGSLHPRKNLVRLFGAFDRFKSQSKNDIKLLVVGEKKWWTSEIELKFNAMTYKDEVVFCGRLKANDLHLVTASALATTYVSYFEGFGIPIIESFRCGVPVITSNVTSMPEVAGDAALLVDPFDEDSISNAMLAIANDPLLRESLIRKGFERAKLFNWDNTARQLWDSILHTIIN